MLSTLGLNRLRFELEIDVVVHSSISSKGCRSSSLKSKHFDVYRRSLQDLLEGTVDGRAHGAALVEVDGGNGALADALRGEFKFLPTVSIVHEIPSPCDDRLTSYTFLYGPEAPKRLRPNCS